MATITPFVKRMRTTGGTIYTFTSALEDIGLNINERNNIVKMSHYALLDIPSIDVDTSISNRFNVLNIPGAFESFQTSGSIKDGKVIVAESFQNYALNLEVNLLAQDTYNPALQRTVSERVFWKWLKETGAIRWTKIDTSAGTYWQEETDTDSSAGYTSVVKCIGEITAGALRTDTFGTYNETYVLVPTSFGQTQVYFKQIEDDNYYHGLSIVDGAANIYGRETYTRTHPDALEYKAYYDLASSTTTCGSYTMTYNGTSGWWWTEESFSLSDTNCYFIDTSTYITSGTYNTTLKYSNGQDVEFRRSKVDCLSIEFDLNKLKTIFNDSALTFDDLAITHAVDDTFEFNAVLLYYSVYSKTLDEVLATNLLGILFLDPPSGNTSGYPASEIIIPTITKIQSGATGFGTSYSFRINVKSDYMLDDTKAIITDSTASQTSLEDFADVLDGLEESLTILNQHTGTINYVTQQYLNMASNQTNIENQISDLQYQVNDITGDITGTADTIAMFADGSDPIVDSSIYMYNGKIGMYNTKPTYPVQIDASVKVKDLVIENAIYDSSQNFILNNDSLKLGNWTFDASGTSLYLKYGSTIVFRFTSDGSINMGGTLTQNVTF